MAGTPSWSARDIKIGFFVLNDPAQAAVISASNGEFITARDWTDTAAEQITALQNAGCDAILAIVSTAPAGDWQKALLSQGVTAIIDGTTAENGTNVLGADLGLTGVAQLDLVFTQGGGCRVELRQPVAAAEMESRRATWLAMSTADAAQADTAADAADPGKDTEAVGAVTPLPPPRRQTRPSRPVRTLYQRRGGDRHAGRRRPEHPLHAAVHLRGQPRRQQNHQLRQLSGGALRRDRHK